MSDPRAKILEILRTALKPLMKFCLRNAISIQDITEMMKLSLLDAAQEELVDRSERVNVSRLAASTGMHRRDVMRLYRDKEARTEPQGLITKVIGQWQNHPDFCTARRRGRVLTHEGRESEFRALVRSVSQDLDPGTILFELERIGLVEFSPRGVKLISRAFITQDFATGMAMLGQDVADLGTAVMQNVLDKPELPNLHAKVEYDRVSADNVEEIRKWLLEEGTSFIHRVRNYVSAYDLDITPSAESESGTVRVMIEAFGLVEDNPNNLDGK